MMPQLSFVDAPPRHSSESLASIASEGLSRPQKSLPCRFFYDSVGSDLFEKICSLPEYYLTRTERSILERNAGEIAAAAGKQVTLVEFGSGSSCKTRILMDALFNSQARLEYQPIDISRDFLRASSLTLLEEYPGLSITAIGAEYNDAFHCLPSSNLPRLILFLGSNIGNFERPEAITFLKNIVSVMWPEDHLLAGVDLVKDVTVLEAAYNDSMGITEAFNKNLLLRLNHEAGARFRPEKFIHHAPFVQESQRIEMRLISCGPQTVSLPVCGTTIKFEDGEYIHTENSHKYTAESFEELCTAAGLEVRHSWTDENNWFALNLLRRAAAPSAS